jgi:hypothetical protein
LTGVVCLALIRIVRDQREAEESEQWFLPESAACSRSFIRLIGRDFNGKLLSPRNQLLEEPSGFCTFGENQLEY